MSGLYHAGELQAFPLLGDAGLVLGRADCYECSDLLRRYGEATREFAFAGQQLAEAAAAVVETGMFACLWRLCEDARQRCVDLRHLMALHFASHANVDNHD